MRNRSNSGVRLDFYQRMVQKTILKYQNPVTGLLPATPNHPHAWTRDNVYSILAVWGLALAYRKNADLDEDRAKAYELEQSAVKLMRGLLFSMMKQLEKVEKFKYTNSHRDVLHAKYSVQTGHTVVGDAEWGHLQLDATSLYLLILAQMTASGIQIIYTLDEVAFIQNLVFYIQVAYRVPDFGIWERGDKTNHGVPELNASSIGMAKAALEALNELDLFGARGGPSSVIHVMPDEAAQCEAILNSVLPRESNSKETDAALLSVISFPAFAVDDPVLIDLTRQTVLDKLLGRYGLRRFLRDGYKTPKEDPHRLHYELWELQVFEDIECEWPMFFAYLMIDGIFNKNHQQVQTYMEALEKVMIKGNDSFKVMPELYAVPKDKVDAEYSSPKSQDRVADGKVPQMWGQSLYVLGKLVKEGFLSPGELDPLNRRLTAEPKPDIVVQVVILAEDKSIQEKLAYYDLHVQTFEEVAPIQVYPAKVLSHILSYLGKNKKLGLTGRPVDVTGILATSKIYSLGDQVLAFFPQFVDQQQFYLPLDTSLLLDMFKTDVQYVANNWRMLGLPVIIMPIKNAFLDNESFYLVNDTAFLVDIFHTDCAYLNRCWSMTGRPTIIIPIQHWLTDYSQTLHPALVSTIKKLQTGYINGTRVHLSTLKDFLNTSCITNLTFLTESEDSPDLAYFLRYIAALGSSKAKSSRLLNSQGLPDRGRRGTKMRRRMSVKGIIKRTCSIAIDGLDAPELARLQAMYSSHRDSSLLEHSQEDPSSSSTSPGGSIPPSPGPSSPPPDFFSSSVVDGPPTSSLLHPHLKESLLDMESRVLATHDETYQGINCEELVEHLKDAETLLEQADIIHYLFVNKGPEWNTGLDTKTGCKVKDLVMELYDKAGHLKQWWLVRHTAGMLRKKVEDLAKAATDILVRQKQLAVGLPPEPREKIITRPLPPDELAAIIHEACGEDTSTAMLTQEILVYLAMFIRTEPKLFNEMLRLRVGLIIQVMASELARTLKCSGEEASDQLKNLSPYEMKTLLHHILSGKEFGVSSDPDCIFDNVGTMITKLDRKKSTVEELTSIPREPSIDDGLLDNDLERQGQWLRRRRLDGALNRVPVGFYSEIWRVLKRCHGLSIGENRLIQSLTREMTEGEMKFALQVEMILNRVPQPEYRQLMVEALMVLCLIVDHDNGNTHWGEVIAVDRIVHTANNIFIDEQRNLDGDVTLCCGPPGGPPSSAPRPTPLRCQGTAGVCQNFYDLAPSGRYGTMSYMCKASLQLLHFPVTQDGLLDCVVS